MTNNTAIDSLLKKREEIVSEKEKAVQDFDKGIEEIDLALFLLTGQKGESLAQKHRYDDENPNYISGSEDGI